MTDHSATANFASNGPINNSIALSAILDCFLVIHLTGFNKNKAKPITIAYNNGIITTQMSFVRLNSTGPINSEIITKKAQ